MAASYLRRGMDGLATFSLYVRGLPKQRGFLVAAGLEPCLDFLESFAFADDDLGYLAEVGFDVRAIEDFRSLRFDGEVWAVPEGRIVYSEEPILEVTAPVAVAQVVETYLLNQITLHTTLASKAARYVIAADGRDLVDFAFRRTHGTEAAMAVARDSAMVGFVATSNVEAARRYGLTVAGTMAHSFVEAFPSEREAFDAFAEDHPNRTTFLVDTYDTLGGVRTAIDTIQRARPRRPPRDPPRQRRPRCPRTGRPHPAGRRRTATRAHLRERRPRRARGARARAGGRARRRVRGRDAVGGVGRRAVRRLGVQAHGVRRAAGAEALGGQGHRARPQAGVARTVRRPDRAPRRAVATAETAHRLLEPRDARGAPPRPARRSLADARETLPSTDLATVPTKALPPDASRARRRADLARPCSALTERTGAEARAGERAVERERSRGGEPARPRGLVAVIFSSLRSDSPMSSSPSIRRQRVKSSMSKTSSMPGARTTR